MRVYILPQANEEGLTQKKSGAKKVLQRSRFGKQLLVAKRGHFSLKQSTMLYLPVFRLHLILSGTKASNGSPGSPKSSFSFFCAGRLCYRSLSWFQWFLWECLRLNKIAHELPVYLCFWSCSGKIPFPKNKLHWKIVVMTFLRKAGWFLCSKTSGTFYCNTIYHIPLSNCLQRQISSSKCVFIWVASRQKRS